MDNFDKFMVIGLVGVLIFAFSMLGISEYRESAKQQVLIDSGYVYLKGWYPKSKIKEYRRCNLAEVK